MLQPLFKTCVLEEAAAIKLRNDNQHPRPLGAKAAVAARSPNGCLPPDSGGIADIRKPLLGAKFGQTDSHKPSQTAADATTRG